MTDPLKTGDMIGILGGGQLGRMLSVAASRLGLRTHIFEPVPNPPRLTLPIKLQPHLMTMNVHWSTLPNP